MGVTMVRTQRMKRPVLGRRVGRNCSLSRPGGDAIGAYTLVGVPPHGSWTNARPLRAHSCNQLEVIVSAALKEGK